MQMEVPSARYRTADRKSLHTGADNYKQNYSTIKQEANAVKENCMDSFD